jgi:hypothetical protein
MESQWYYTEQGQQSGPVSPAQLKELATSGRLQPTDMVWKEGMAQWSSAGQIKGLFPETTQKQTAVVSPPPLLTKAPSSSMESPARLAITFASQPRDISETVRLSTLIGFGAWLFCAVFFSLLYAPLEGVPFERVFPLALKGGILFGFFMAVLVPFSFVRLRATIRFLDKDDFIRRLNMATSQLGYVGASLPGEFMTFSPSFKKAIDHMLGPTSVKLELDHAIKLGPKMHVKKICKWLETG